MNPQLPLLLALQISIASLAPGAEPLKPSDEVVLMKPYVVEEKSLANAGFAFKARFRHHMIWAGVKELIIVNVGPRSEAKKAGLEVGEKIIQIRDMKVDGLGIKALQNEFEKKSENGKIPLIIQAKDSEKTRLVELQFSEPAAQPKKDVLPVP
jgi:hypothetical protein